MRASAIRRRDFLRSTLRAGLALPLAHQLGSLAWARPGEGEWPKNLGRKPLPLRFSDLKRHFVFEYYAWYGGPPDYVHWDQWDRVPPLDIASNYMPRLGPYDSRSRQVIEQHARWITESGAGAINVSWWGPDSFEDRNLHHVMDVMRAHDLKVTFHLEPYRNDRGQHFASDVLYLLREYGEKRRFDALLLLRNADGRQGPVLKGFRMVVPERVVDCHGVERRVSDHTADQVWRQQTDLVRNTLRRDFDHVTLLADSTDTLRVANGGFDGIAIYDHFIPPASYSQIAGQASSAGLLFSFNVNPGFDTIEPREIEPGSCYQPTPFAPETTALDWRRAEERERAARRSSERIRESFAATVAAQTDSHLLNSRRGFFLAYLNSFNEWHEGHAFEPMKDEAALNEVERAYGYHNPERGDYRLETLSELLHATLEPRASSQPAA